MSEEMELKQALEITGFEKCEFGPDSDPCENCGMCEQQLYYRRTSYWENEGEYNCETCVVEHAKQQ